MRNTLVVFALGTALLASCESKAGTGALVGAGGGALIGGVAGGGTGALIGAGVGAVGGAIIGYTLDEHDRAVMESRSPQTLKKIDNGEQLSLQDVKNMSRNGLSDETIMNQIKATNSTYRLTADEIISLKKAGVSERVIDYMIQTGQ